MTLGVIDLGTLSHLNVYLGIILNALFGGLGTGIGIYVANKHIIGNSQKLINKLKDIKLKGGKNGRKRKNITRKR